jgi:hypothetical protein
VIKLSLKKINGLCTAFNFHNWALLKIIRITYLSLYLSTNRFLKTAIIIADLCQNENPYAIEMINVKFVAYGIL